MTSSHTPLGDGAEFDTIRRLLEAWGPAASGIGDDAAILDLPPGERLVISTDATVEGIHFRRDWMSAEQIGARATTAALSDLAAMAAAPRALLLSLGLPHNWRAGLMDIGRGVAAVASSVRCPIVGGNISAAEKLSLTFTVVGSTARPLTRSGASAGDIIFVTGHLGAPGAALRAYLADTVPLESYRKRFVSPTARIAEALWLAGHGASAAIDVSDGLHADAVHLARASNVSIVINGSAVPRSAGVTVQEALQSGEEYELLVAFPRDAHPNVAEFSECFGVELTPIGVVAPVGAQAVEVTNVDVGHVAGFDHLS